MIPGAGLYLPHSSHVNHEAASTRTEARTMKQKYFERKTALQDKDKNLNTGRTPSRTSLALSRKSTEDVTKVFSSLSTVFDFADYASSHEKVSSNSEVFINLLQRVRQDVTEASRLYKSQAVADYFDSWPDKKTYVDAILLDIQRALNDIGIYMETVRVSGDDGGSVGLRRKFEWVLSHHKKLISKQQNLTVCHQSLMTAVHVMLTAEMNVAFNGQDPIYEAPTRPWIPEDARDIFRSPHSRQKWRSSQRNLSMPSIVVSEARNDKSLGKQSTYRGYTTLRLTTPQRSRLILSLSSYPEVRLMIYPNLIIWTCMPRPRSHDRYRWMRCVSTALQLKFLRKRAYQTQSSNQSRRKQVWIPQHKHRPILCPLEDRSTKCDLQHHLPRRGPGHLSGNLVHGLTLIKLQSHLLQQLDRVHPSIKPDPYQLLMRNHWSATTPTHPSPSRKPPQSLSRRCDTNPKP